MIQGVAHDLLNYLEVFSFFILIFYILNKNYTKIKVKIKQLKINTLESKNTEYENMNLFNQNKHHTIKRKAYK